MMLQKRRSGGNRGAALSIERDDQHARKHQRHAAPLPAVEVFQQCRMPVGNERDERETASHHDRIGNADL